MIKFLCLGSGSSGNSYFLTTGNTSILIDAGLSMRALRKHLQANGFEVDKVDAVFVTHDHADHIKAVGNLANDLGIPIYATPEVHKGINRNYCVTSKLTEKHVRFISKEQIIQFGDFSITAFEVPHDSSDCVGYRVEAEGVTFCLITDVGHATEVIQKKVSEANYLVLESNHDEEMLVRGPYPAYLKGRIRSGRGHLSNRDCANLLAEHATEKLKHVWLCHLSEENNHPELARKTVSAVLRSFGLIDGVDFKVDILKRKTPSLVHELTI
ncbi:MAG: MBL fold metallo-hydrolase [Bacteroidaceae bacterium]|nr:MBL fold metallo-hydrolase [Bacteroidaceae bacterium]